MDKNYLKIVAISDVHTYHKELKLPKGDMLIIAGDICSSGSFEEAIYFINWLEVQPFKYKLLVPGNHDRCFENKQLLPILEQVCKDKNIILLIDKEVKIEGFKIWGSPVTPYFHNWAFNKYPDDIKKHWKKIPKDLDILITHGPCYGYLDVVEHRTEHLGCPELLKQIKKKKPKIMIHGHIHSGYGKAQCGYTTIFNVSVCDERYSPIQPPTEFILKKI